MWEIGEPKFEPAKPNYEFKWLNKGNQVWIDEVMLINATGCLDFSEHRYQFLICEECGYVECNYGDWVLLRSSGEWAFVLPDFAVVQNPHDDFDERYGPPWDLVDKGVGFIERDCYIEHYQGGLDFPAFEGLEPLTSWEALKLYQLEATDKVVGSITDEPAIDKTDIFVSSVGEYREMLTKVEAQMEELAETQYSARLERVRKGDEVVTFYLDLPGTPGWPAAVVRDDEVRLWLVPGFVIEG